MNEKKAYCIHCGKETPYVVILEQRTASKKYKHVPFLKKISLCRECSEEVYVEDIIKENIEASKKAM